MPINHPDAGVEREPSMAQKINAQVVGGSLKQFDNVSTVADLKKAMNLQGNYQATVNGEVQDDSYELQDYEFVSFAQQVKGA